MSKNKNKPQAAPAKVTTTAAGKRYWRNPIHFETLGACSGQVTEEQELLFRASSPDSEIMDWTTATDEVAAKKKELRAKRRKDLGLEA